MRSIPSPGGISNRLITSFGLLVVSLSCCTTRASILYRETFGDSNTGSQDAAQSFDWAVHAGSTAVNQSASTGTTNAINRTANASKPGSSDTIGNVNAGTVIGTIPAAYGQGIAFASTAAGPVIFWTPEYPTASGTGSGINPNLYSTLKFSWYEGNGDITGSWRVAVKVGGQWYVTQQQFLTTAGVANAANFALGGDDGNGGTSHGSELKSFIYSTNASTWFLLNFDGAFTLGGTPGTGTGASGTVLSLGAQPGANLSGTIDAFGMFSDVVGTANRRFDTFTIDGTLNASITASNQSVSLLFNTSANLALGASNTNNTALTFYIANNPTNGALGTLNSNLVTYTPNVWNYVGLDSIHVLRQRRCFHQRHRYEVSISVTNTEILYPSSPQITKGNFAVVINDYVIAPLSGRTAAPYNETNLNFGDQLGRLNFLRSEPTNAPLSASRFFVADNNRNLYILSRTDNPPTTNSFKSYINFEHVFPKFDNNPGFAGGLVTFQFDPEYTPPERDILHRSYGRPQHRWLRRPHQRLSYRFQRHGLHYHPSGQSSHWRSAARGCACRVDRLERQQLHL